jgi:lipid-A-disaccharide synthase
MNRSTQVKKIMFSAGELSGDEHGAALLKNLKSLLPENEFFGMGGRNLRREGLEVVVDAERSGSIMGITEIITGLGRIFQSWQTMKELLRVRQPDLLIIINYSEFNLRLARIAKSLSIKVVFYIPPQVWAWRSGRVKVMNQLCDLIVTIFPFEKKFYHERGCDKVAYVGHPFVNQFQAQAIDQNERAQLRQELGFSPEQKLVLLFPGSRRKEIAAHFDFVLDTFRLVQAENAECQGLLVSARKEWVEEFRARIPSDLRITVTHGDSQKLLQIGEVGLIKSGTSNLQATFSKLPFVMYYRPTRGTAIFIRRFVKGVSQYSIVNILRPNTVPEIVGEYLDPTQTAKHLLDLVSQGPQRQQMLESFDEIIKSLSGADERAEFVGLDSASKRTAQLVKQLLT